MRRAGQTPLLAAAAPGPSNHSRFANCTAVVAAADEFGTGFHDRNAFHFHYHCTAHYHSDPRAAQVGVRILSPREVTESWGLRRKRC